jgi:two-component system sensor histidine kinase UhpB
VTVRGIGERPVLQKIIAVNAAVLLIGAVVGVWMTRTFADAPVWLLALGFFFTGCVIMGAVNYLVLRTTFRPLLELSDALARIHKGERERGLPSHTGDPNLRSVSTAVDEMLDRLEGESRRYSAKLFEAIEDERRRIGRELHDDTSQTLAAALINLDLAEKGLSATSPDAHKRVENSKDLIQYCLDQIKLLVYDLRPSMLDDLGLVPALRWYIQSHLQASELEVETDFELARGRLPGHIETAFYRIAQESLANVVKHSMATRVTIGLEFKPGYASMAIIDNGTGFVPDEVIYDEEGRFGIGLLSIKERIELLDGTVTIDSAHGKGTHVHVVVPLEEVETV